MKKYGFIPPKIEADHYVLGGIASLPKEILQPDSNWAPFLPTYEPQYNDTFDSSGCTVYGTENAIEALSKRVFADSPNYSERYIYILSGTQPPGNDPHVIAETIRSKGLIDDANLPMTQSFDEYLRPNPMSQEFLAEGARWLSTRSFGHEWVWTSPLDKKARAKVLREALRYSPVGISVTAWHKDGDYYVDNGLPNNHWCLCYGLEEKDGETYILIFDTYEQDLKKLHSDHTTSFAKRYWLKKKEPEQSFLSKLFSWIH